jgi:hypothetical protein
LGEASGRLEGTAIALILVVGFIHLLDAPGSFDEAAYKGVLFLLNPVGALIAAIGIYRGAWSWGWILGLVVAGGAFVGYVISRTVGLPGLPPDVWFEELGVLSLVVEAAFVVVFVVAASRRKQERLENSPVP